MEENLLKIFKLADELNEKQDKIFVEIEYTADERKRLVIYIRSKENFKYIEKCEANLTKDSFIRWDNIVKLFENYVNDGGVDNE